MTASAKSKRPDVRIRRAYEPANPNDGYRILIDRLWPRGLTHDELPYDEWNKNLAPSPSLRTWFGHKAENWDEFCRRYRLELQTPQQKANMRKLVSAAQGQSITLVYGAKDIEHNHARVLAEEIMSLY